jgi:hypothetical protein
LTYLLDDYATFNPHARFTLHRAGEETRAFEPTDTGWKKWRPDAATGAHWYESEQLRDLIAAYLAVERRGGQALTVRDFVSRFAGLSSPSKQKAAVELAGLSRAHLHDLASGDDVQMGDVRRLLSAMCHHTRPIRPEALGVLGKEHLADSLHAYGVAEDSITYRKAAETDGDGRPFVLETAFGVRDDPEARRLLIGGVNWAAALGMPFPELPGMCGALRIEPHDPVVVVVHLAKPGVLFADRGKGRVAGAGEDG